MSMDRKIEKKKWPPKRIAAYAAGGVFVIVVIYIFFFADKSSKLNVERDRITISTVERGPFQEFIPVQGTVEPIETFFLDVSEGGRVQKKFVQEGAFLDVGDPIISLDNANLRLNIMYNEAQLFLQMNNLRSTRLAMEQTKLNYQGQLIELEYRLKEAERTYNNNKKLVKQNLVSQHEYERSRDEYLYLKAKLDLTLETIKKDSLFRETQVQQLEMSVDQMQQNLDVTKQQLENLTIRATISGQLTSLKVEVGESISPGENIGKIDDVDSFKVRAQVDEFYLTRVHEGLTGTVTIAGEEYVLTIRTVYPEVRNGSFEVDMLFNRIPSSIRKGQTMHIRLNLGDPREAILVDRGGFYQTTGGQWIFVVDESGDFATRRKIRIGQQNTQVFEVLEGLEPGEKVITSSYDNYGDIEKLVIND